MKRVIGIGGFSSRQKTLQRSTLGTSAILALMCKRGAGQRSIGTAVMAIPLAGQRSGVLPQRTVNRFHPTAPRL